MNCLKTAEHIAAWLDSYAAGAGVDGFVVGVSGGVDSALSSTLAAMTGRPTLCATMPIHQAASHVSRAEEHIAWLKGRFPRVGSVDINLTGVYENFLQGLPCAATDPVQQMANANSRSRLRMTTLYYLAALNNALVVGTGNKIEDYAIGFFTKYGDGGVDVSPIADLTKSEVYALASALGVCESIRSAPPTDGLFGDGRTDEQQIGATYAELEWAMEQVDAGAQAEDFEGRQREVVAIYIRLNRANRHKMAPAPVCKIPDELREL
ncbi:MAG: NAD(+) synthase [Rikenellaceae bacterium]|jgi:NAD+ synthase|nr:NAD(+) synthase [Rikenellaceae bacterium]